jgi:replicative DNA helicase
MLVLDYLQLLYIRGGRGSRYEEVTEISRELKLLSKSAGIPILALSQLSRASEKEGKRKPRLSDLRESGAIEQDADMVFFLHTEDEERYELITAKNRSGPTGTGELQFEKKYSRFTERTL